MALGLCALGCDGTTSISFVTSTQRFELSTMSVGLPTELRDDTSTPATVRSVDCAATGVCPPTEGSVGVALACEGGVCDPAPKTVDAPVGDVVDFEAMSMDLRDILSTIDSIEITSAEYQIELNTLTIDLMEIEVYWGPEGATAIDPASGVFMLGVMPPTAAGATGTGEMALDADGNAALSDYLVGTSRRVRFFARTRIDLAPGGPFPEGSITAGCVLSVRAVGRIAK